MQQTLEALTLLHGARITHRDIKPENILIQCKAPLSVKLADFSLGTDRSIQETFCGSSFYVAPEVVQNAVYTTAVDIWSLGVVVLQYWSGHPTWKAMTKGRGEIKGNTNWHRDLVQIANEMSVSAPCFELVRKMLLIEPSSRPDAKTCLSILSREEVSQETSDRGKALFGEMTRELTPLQIRALSFLEPGAVEELELKAKG